MKNWKPTIKGTVEKNHVSYNIIFTLLCVLVFYPPFARGLFFERELLVYHTLSFSLFVGFVIYKRLKGETIITKSKLDYAIIGLIVAYILPIIFGNTASLRLAIGEWIKYLNYYAIFLMIKGMVRGKREIDILLNLIIIAGAGMAILGIDGAVGMTISQKIEGMVNVIPGMNYKISSTYYGDRMASMMQYPNTFGAYLLAMIMLCLGLLISKTSKNYSIVYGGIGCVFLLALVFTYSRGAWIILPFLWVLFLIMIGNVRHIVTAILYTMSMGIPAVISIPLFHQAIINKDIKGLFIVFVGALSAMVLSYFSRQLVKCMHLLSQKRLIQLMAGIVTVIIISSMIMFRVALHTEDVVQLSHTPEEKDSFKGVEKIITKIDGNVKYKLTFDAASASKAPADWAYQIRIDSIGKSDNEKQQKQETIKQIYNETNLTMDHPRTITFVTPKDTEKINISVYNYNVGTSVALKNMYLTNLENQKTRKVIFKYKYIPDSIAKRLNSINASTYTVVERLVFYKDAMKIVKIHPLFGSGGGAWESMYFAYQSYLYYTTEAHNYVMQLMCEVGIFGLSMWLLLLIGIGYHLYDYKKRNKEKRGEEYILVVTAFIAVHAIFIHSLIDFNLTYSAVYIMVMVLLAVYMVLIHNKGNIKEDKKNKRMPYIFDSSAVLLAVILIILSISLNIGRKNGNIANEMQLIANVDELIQYVEKAEKFDPFSSTYKINLANLYQRKYYAERNNSGEEAQKKFHESEKLILKALKNEPYNSNNYANAARFYGIRNEYEKAVEYMEKAVDYQPLVIEKYTELADLYYKLGVLYMNNNEKEKGQSYLQKVVNLPDRLEKVNTESMRPILIDEKTLEHIERCDYLLKSYGDEMSVMIFNRLKYNAFINIDLDDNAVPDFWHLWNSTSSNMHSEIKENGKLRINNTGSDTGYLKAREIKLEPNKNYGLILKIKAKNPQQDAVTIHVLSTQGKDKYQFSQKIVELNGNEQTKVYGFTTDEDIGKGKEYVRFDIKGDIVISELILFENE